MRAVIKALIQTDVHFISVSFPLKLTNNKVTDPGFCNREWAQPTFMTIFARKLHQIGEIDQGSSAPAPSKSVIVIIRVTWIMERYIPLI